VDGGTQTHLENTASPLAHFLGQHVGAVSEHRNHDHHDDDLEDLNETQPVELEQVGRLSENDCECG
jgi:hypothetical protein